MNVMETMQYIGERAQIAMVIGSVPTDGSGDIEILYANGPAVALFEYPSQASMIGIDVRSLMPPQIAREHRTNVSSYVEKANGGKVRTSTIMGAWRELEAVKADGNLTPVSANVCDIRNTEERYFLAFFKDRKEAVKREMELAEALELAEKATKEANEAKRAAEDGLLKQKRLSGQITLLRQIFAGTVGLIIMLGVLIVAQWATGTSDPDGLAMIERVLLVLTGILGSAMASVFDSRNRSSE